MRTSVSHLKSHLECPRKAHNQCVELRGPSQQPKALVLGTWLHEVLAKRMQAIAQGKQQPRFRKTDSTVIMDFDVATVPREYQEEALKLAYVAQDWNPPDWEVIAVEEEMATQIGHHEVVGRLDAVVKWNGYFWHVQHKSLARNSNLANFSELIRYDWHEVVYQKMAEEAGFQPFAGTILNVIKKNVPAGESAFWMDYLNREPEVSASILKDIEFTLDNIERQYIFEKESQDRLVNIGMLNLPYKSAGGYNDRIIGNRSACMGPFKNSPCSYLQVCNKVTDLDDDSLYIDLEARYAKSQENQASSE
jgi:hypothetical protein